MYIVKHNVPDFPDQRATFNRKAKALQFWHNQQRLFMLFEYPYKTFLRNEKGKPLRGRCQVEVDGFYYYSELYKE